MKIELNACEREFIVAALGLVKSFATEAQARANAENLAAKILWLEQRADTAELAADWSARGWRSRAEMRDREF